MTTMNPEDKPAGQAFAVPQGFSPQPQDRLPPMAQADMTPAQQAAAAALIAGPRKAVFGPFIALLRSPELMGRLGKVGEYLRFDSVLDARIRELAMCVVARTVCNQFEWLMHAPLALQAGVAGSTLASVAAGKHPRGLPDDELAALELVQEVLQHHGASDASYAEALALFGEQGVVELVSLVGYFVTVCWVMNVARTPTQGVPGLSALAAFPP